MKKIKYGIIGAGTMAREHILNISLIDNAEVVALSDPHEDSLNQCKEILKTNVSCFKRHQEMIKENIEIMEKSKPDTLGQASRITGMTPAAITILRVFLRTKQAA